MSNNRRLSMTLFVAMLAGALSAVGGRCDPAPDGDGSQAALSVAATSTDQPVVATETATATPYGAMPTLPPEQTVNVPPAESTSLPETAPTAAPNRPDAIVLKAGQPVVGGNAYRAGRFTFVVPPQVTLNTALTLNDPGGFMLFVIYEEKTMSALRLFADTGVEEGRTVADPALAAIFESIAKSVVTDQN